MDSYPEKFGVLKITSKYVRSIAYRIQQDQLLRRRLTNAKHAKDQSPLTERYTMPMSMYNDKSFKHHVVEFVKKYDPDAIVEFSCTNEHVTLRTDDEVWAYAFVTNKRTGMVETNMKPTFGILQSKHPTDTEPRYFAPYDKDKRPRIKKRRKLQTKSGEKSEIYITSTKEDAIKGYNQLVARAVMSLYDKTKYMTNNHIGPLPQ
ncbi:MAG: hypothetical protein HDQ88_06395, partial [Clostridia bacterium]|nr:hypothetical protein [Clostridia bacterium]